MNDQRTQGNQTRRRNEELQCKFQTIFKTGYLRSWTNHEKINIVADSLVEPRIGREKNETRVFLCTAIYFAIRNI